MSSENSQHIADWYTFSHIIHGFLFYGLFWLIRRITGLPISFGLALILSILLEASWEIAENTNAVIGALPRDDDFAGLLRRQRPQLGLRYPRDDRGLPRGPLPPRLGDGGVSSCDGSWWSAG